MRRYRFPDISATEAGCTVCGLLFVDAVSFDVHRGITAHPRSETAVDLGRCLTPVEMERKGMRQHGDRWGTREAVARVTRMAEIRAKR